MRARESAFGSMLASLALLALGSWRLVGEPASRLARQMPPSSPRAKRQAPSAAFPVPVSPLMTDRRVPGIVGRVGCQMDARNGYRLQTVAVGGRRYTAGPDFPTFLVLDKQGRRQTLGAADSRWQVQARKQGPDTV